MLDNDNASLTTLDDATPELDLFSIFGDSPQTTALDFESPLLLSSPMFSSDANPMFTDSGFTQKSTLSQQPDFYFPPLQSELVQQQPVNFAPLPAEQPTLAPSDTVTLTIAQLSQLLAANQPVQQHQLKAVKSHACPQCGREFTRRFNMLTHLKTHDKNRARPFVCSTCSKSFTRVADLQRHEGIHSKSVLDSTCKTCNKIFSRTDALKRHVDAGHCCP